MKKEENERKRDNNGGKEKDCPQMTQKHADEKREETGREEAGDPQTYAILGACMEVHRTLGHGFLEAVYQEALACELSARGISFVRESPLPVRYKQHVLPCSYKADFICHDAVLVELKALARLTSADHAQVINYLKATGLARVLLVNFGVPRLEYKRFVLSPSPPPTP
jgi:GxxExxY protein